MTPELESALATPHAQRLLHIAAASHADVLGKLEKSNTKAGYPEAATLQRGDAQLIEEVLLPALTTQTDLGLDAGQELSAFLSIRFGAHLRKLKAEVARHLMNEDDALADELVGVVASELGARMGTICAMIAERAHHDGLCARALLPAETLLRVLREVTSAGEDPSLRIL